MYLKRLELYGFKTFADRTELEFGPGITAIVGPNGSGKSNISDAILWVLGEQAMKSLRSAKGVDIIFKGSDARKALGMAEAHLTLDNSSGMLPTDYTEVTVSRRVFRSGESEYQLNRVPVRLRDVQDLFMDTGIGKQSYSIISQGEVDAVLSSRSEERRALFEEVAGISKYKQRKKDALRKLEQTRLNLLRVHDIISELESQIGPLSEQSEKAKEYQVLHAELTDLRLSLLVMQYQGLQGSLTRSKERETETQQELEELRHTLHQAEVTETTLRAELQAMEDELEERRGVETQFLNAIQAAENKLELLKQQVETAGRERERLEHERAEWERQSGQFDAEIAAADAEQARLSEVIAGVEAEIAEMTAKLAEVDAALSDRAKEVQERRGAYLDALDGLSRMRNDLARVESLLRTSEGRSSRITAELNELAVKVTERRAALETATKQATARQQERETLAKKRLEANRSRQAAAESRESLRKEENRLREELAGLRARQRTLQELEESLEGYFPGVRAVMAAVTNNKLRGWFAPVSDLLDVPAELETALEVGLGANLQDVVTGSEADAREAIALLKSSGAGRATFLPLDLISPAPCARVTPDSGILGVASDLIRYNSQYGKIVQHLLGRMIIARDLTAALALAKSNGASGWNRIVTLDGEVVTPARAITGGSAGKGGGLLKRKRELQELTEGIDTMAGKADALQKKVQQAVADVQRLDGEIAALLKQDEQVAAAFVEAQRVAATVQREITSLDERVTSLREEADWVQREVESAKAEEAEHLEKVKGLELRQAEMEEAITEAERTLAGGQQNRNTLAEEFSALQLKHTEARGQAQAHQNAARRTAELRDSLAERLARNAASLTTLEGRLADIAVQQGEAGKEVDRLREAHTGSAGELQAARDRRTALLETIAANLEEQKNRRETIEECQGRLHRIDLRSTQVETEIGFLEGQFFEDYRLTPDQATGRATPIENRGIAVVRLKELQGLIEEMGTVNLGAIEEFERIGERLTFLTAQRKDLEEGRDSLAKVIAEIDATCKEKFIAAFAAISVEFQDLFVRLFGGGTTQLSLIDPSDVLESGIDIHVTIPGRKNQELLQLSGGERALTALALLFAMLRVKPSPFVVLDEIDAPLDEANIGRYCEVLRDFAATTQFLTITHNKGTMEAADVLYGVTMEKAGVSKIVSVRLSEGHHAHAEPTLAGVSDQNGPYRNERKQV
ncbi:MAG: chromosome segregation protein SMC [Armatimonadota bacterium]